MIAAEAETSVPRSRSPTSAELAETQASLEYARLTQMIEQLAAKQEEAEKATARARGAGVARGSRAARVAYPAERTAPRLRRRSRRSRSRAAAGAASA